MKAVLIVIILFLGLNICPAGTAVTGKVLRVIDGDTIVVRLSSDLRSPTSDLVLIVRLSTAEAQARHAGVGLWKSKQSIPPWLFRQSREIH